MPDSTSGARHRLRRMKTEKCAVVEQAADQRRPAAPRGQRDPESKEAMVKKTGPKRGKEDEKDDDEECKAKGTKKNSRKDKKSEIEEECEEVDQEEEEVGQKKTKAEKASASKKSKEDTNTKEEKKNQKVVAEPKRATKRKQRAEEEHAEEDAAQKERKRPAPKRSAKRSAGHQEEDQKDAPEATGAGGLQQGDSQVSLGAVLNRSETSETIPEDPWGQVEEFEKMMKEADDRKSSKAPETNSKEKEAEKDKDDSKEKKSKGKKEKEEMSPEEQLRAKAGHARRMRFFRSLTSESSPMEVRHLAEKARDGGRHLNAISTPLVTPFRPNTSVTIRSIDFSNWFSLPIWTGVEKSHKLEALYEQWVGGQ